MHRTQRLAAVPEVAVVEEHRRVMEVAAARAALRLLPRGHVLAILVHDLRAHRRRRPLRGDVAPDAVVHTAGAGRAPPGGVHGALGGRDPPHDRVWGSRGVLGPGALAVDRREHEAVIFDMADVLGLHAHRVPRLPASGSTYIETKVVGHRGAVESPVVPLVHLERRDVGIGVVLGRTDAQERLVGAGGGHPLLGSQPHPHEFLLASRLPEVALPGVGGVTQASLGEGA
mmetsp:Transcript_53330/g.169533  ORF Transcript_53330/g.169533 Transcript_53330/m.169533 type:complete len:229 (+) Transcript_53330:2009-2695(+)